MATSGQSKTRLTTGLFNAQTFSKEFKPSKEEKNVPLRMVWPRQDCAVQFKWQPTWEAVDEYINVGGFGW